MARKRRPVFAEELEGQDSALLAAMEYYDTPNNREEFLNLHYAGDVPETIPPEDEAGFPEQFKHETLDVPPMTEEVQ
jgi:hypothetical protein